MISIEKAILADICLGLPLGKIALNVPDDFDAESLAAAPKTFLFRGEQLALLKALYEKKEGDAAQAVSELIRSADEAMQKGPFSVTDKPNMRFSSDPNDYQSHAKYFWPRSGDQAALYERRDGAANPECYSEDFDNVRLTRFSETVVLLSLAAFLSDDDKYANRATLLLRTWFIDPTTRQNPHFQYGQIVPGRTEVRWQSTIEARYLIYVTESIQLLASTSKIAPDELAKIEDWFSALLEWMRTSEHGQGAKQAKNNIGIWYDLQCLVYAHFCGEIELAEHILHKDVARRISQQVAADGSLPNELDRAFPQDYIVFTLAAMSLLSRAGESKGLKIWDQMKAGGRSFQSAHDWLLKAGEARRLLSAFSDKPSDQESEFQDFGFLLETGVRLRTFQRAAEANRATFPELRAQLEKAKREEAAAVTRAELLFADREVLIHHAADLKTRYQMVLKSTSWRVTRPLRIITRKVKSLVLGKPAKYSYIPRYPTLSEVDLNNINSGPMFAENGERESSPTDPSSESADKEVTSNFERTRRKKNNFSSRDVV